MATKKYHYMHYFFIKDNLVLIYIIYSFNLIFWFTRDKKEIIKVVK
jgi:hypothetical protein